MAFKRDKIDTLAGDFNKAEFVAAGTNVLSNEKLTCFIRYLISAERQRGAIGKANPANVAGEDFEQWLKLHGCDNPEMSAEILAETKPVVSVQRIATASDWLKK
jgi:hypothetical protein